MYEIGVYIQIALLIASLTVFIISKVVRENTKLTGGLNPLQMCFLAKGEVSLGDLVMYIPYWQQQGYIDISFDNKKMVLRKINELSCTCLQSEQIMFQSLFIHADSMIFELPNKDMVQKLRESKMAIGMELDTKGQRLFTKASMVGNGFLHLFLWLSILTNVIVVAIQMKLLSFEAESIGMLLGIIGIAIAVDATTISALGKITSADDRMIVNHKTNQLIGILMLVSLNVANLLVLGFVFIYLNTIFVSVLLYCIAYLLMIIMRLFVKKRTNTINSVNTAISYENILPDWVKKMDVTDSNKAQILDYLVCMKRIWDYEAELKISLNSLTNL